MCVLYSSQRLIVAEMGNTTRFGCQHSPFNLGTLVPPGSSLVRASDWTLDLREGCSRNQSPVNPC